MAFIGNTNTTQSFAPAIDYFNGNGSTVAFTLSRPVASVAQVQVVVNNVQQNPADAYTVSGSTITFTSAPSSGTSNIYVYYTSPITQVVQPSTGTVGKTQLDVYGGTGTGAMTVPTGTTAQRPSAPVAGDSRWNTTLNQLEVWTGVAWQAVASTAYSVNYLIVAGGGGGSVFSGGGGGGLLSGTVSLSAGTAYAITVGAGGSAATNGADSSFNSATSIGGGRGGIANSANNIGGSGGSGGGSAYPSGGSGNFYAGGAGTAGQGNAGGAHAAAAGIGVAGGGGGAGAAGSASSGGTAGAGGAGLASIISGASVTYAGGGGSYGESSNSAGGAGGGGAGSNSTGTAGTANTGGGGGGGGGAGGAGGSGVVIISYAGAQRGTGGAVTSSGGYTIHTFTSSSTYTA